MRPRVWRLTQHKHKGHAMTVDKQRDNNEGGCTGKGFKKGQSGNPNGRPPKDRCLRDILTAIGVETPDGAETTRIELLCRKVYEQADNGQRWAVEFIAERTEGKAASSVEIKTTGPKEITRPVITFRGGKRNPLLPEEIEPTRIIYESRCEKCDALMPEDDD